MLGLAHELLTHLIRSSSMLGRRFPYCPHSHLVPDDLGNSKDKSFEKNRRPGVQLPPTAKFGY